MLEVHVITEVVDIEEEETTAAVATEEVDIVEATEEGTVVVEVADEAAVITVDVTIKAGLTTRLTHRT